MISDDYGLYLASGIGFVWLTGVGCFIIDMIAKPKRNTIIKRTKKKPPVSSATHNIKEDDFFVIVDDVSFPI